MDNKKIGIIIICTGLLFGVILVILSLQINALTAFLMQQSGGNCFVNGKCVHEQNTFPLIFGAVFVALTISFGLYLIYFAKKTQDFEGAQRDMLETIKSSKNEELKGERFNILLGGLDEFEKKVLIAVKEQDGISQSTLKYRTDLTKSKLSMVLAQLEKKGLVSKVKKGKTNDIFLKKAF